jgi:PAS domain S-box-containing protein
MAKAKILVVEDESIIALDIASRLRSLGYTVPAMASSGEEAIEKVAQICPDLVLMDINLKNGMDGIEAASRIQAYSDVPVIYLTAHADDATIQRAKLAQPFGYVLKPVEENELHTNIEMALYRHRMEKKLKESESWLSTTLNSIGDAVIATDTQARIQLLNSVAERLTGWTQQEAAGRDSAEVFKILDGRTHTPMGNPVTQVLHEGIATELGDNVLLVAKDGKEIPIDDSAAPIKDDQDNISGVVVIFRDVTRRRQAEEALRQRTAELEKRNEELDAFAHTAAHDLKSPLSLIVGYAQVLEEIAQENGHTLPDEDMGLYLNRIVQTGLKMGTIIDELLLLSAVRNTEVSTEPLDMKRIVTGAQARLALMIENHRAEIVPTDTWPASVGHAPWIEEVWANYLSNAIKYGGQPPRVEVGATMQPDGMVRFWVKDNGRGIAPGDQKRLFSPFTRLDQDRANGHGLGLSIVRRIVEKLGGQVAVESEVGRGSVFSFTLPGVACPETGYKGY